MEEIAQVPGTGWKVVWRENGVRREVVASTLVSAVPAFAVPGLPWPSDMRDALEALRIVTILANPALPNTTQTIWGRLGLTGDITDLRIEPDTAWGRYPGGTTVTKGDPLFPRKNA